MQPITAGDLDEAQKKDITDQIKDAQYMYFRENWQNAVDPKDRAQMTFNFDDYLDEPVYQFYERLIEAIKNN